MREATTKHNNNDVEQQWDLNDLNSGIKKYKKKTKADFFFFIPILNLCIITFDGSDERVCAVEQIYNGNISIWLLHVDNRYNLFTQDLSYFSVYTFFFLLSWITCTVCGGSILVRINEFKSVSLYFAALFFHMHMKYINITYMIF